MGATGLICPNAAHHVRDADSVHHDQDAATAHQHDGHFGLSAHADAAHDTPGAHDGAVSECCFSAYPAPAALPDFASPDVALKVSAVVDSAVMSRAGDGLFRPPRTPAP